MDRVRTPLPNQKARLNRATNHMDQNQNDNQDLRLLELGLEIGDRDLLEWLELALMKREREKLPSIQID